jgi:hypothetical protein
MFVASLLAASILLTPPERNPEILRQIERGTMTMLVCKAVLPDSLWDTWIRLAFIEGLTVQQIDGMREVIANNPPLDVNEEVCLEMIGQSVTRIKVLMAEEDQG